MRQVRLGGRAGDVELSGLCADVLEHPAASVRSALVLAERRTERRQRSSAVRGFP